MIKQVLTMFSDSMHNIIGLFLIFVHHMLHPIYFICNFEDNPISKKPFILKFSIADNW